MNIILVKHGRNKKHKPLVPQVQEFRYICTGGGWYIPLEDIDLVVDKFGQDTKGLKPIEPTSDLEGMAEIYATHYQYPDDTIRRMIFIFELNNN